MTYILKPKDQLPDKIKARYDDGTTGMESIDYLLNLFEPTIINSKGIKFKNRVPIVQAYPECFFRGSK